MTEQVSKRTFLTFEVIIKVDGFSDTSDFDDADFVSEKVFYVVKASGHRLNYSDPIQRPREAIDLVENIHQASYFEDKSAKFVIDLYQNVQRLTAHRFTADNVKSIRMVEVTIDIQQVEHSIDVDDYLMERKYRALNKLTDEDVKLLDLEKTATYFKLKYHKNPDLDNDSIF